MEPRVVHALLRIGFAAIIATATWATNRYLVADPEPRAANAPVSQFSAARAEGVLARVLGREIPHPVATDENEAVRNRILREYEALGVPVRTYRALGCHISRNFPSLACATVTDVIAEVRPGAGKAIVMLSHIDSVPAGAGAADDESGTASIIESVRALRASKAVGLHPILALNTDGEEFGLLGAAAFLRNPDYVRRVGAVINVEARGNRGPSLLFQTSPGDGPLLDLYANSVPDYATSSLMPVIYRFLPNDTDLSLFVQRGILSWNFAFNDNVAHYHTALDRRANLDPVSLQMQGDNMLGMVNGLEHVPFATLEGPDAIYVSVLGRWLPRIPSRWAVPVSLAAFVALVFCALRVRERDQPAADWLRAFLILPVLVMGAGVAGWILHSIAALVSGRPDPSFAYPSLLRAALALGVFTIALVTSRLSRGERSVLAGWLWVSVLSIATAIFLTGASAYFIFGLIVAVPFLLFRSLARLAPDSGTGRLLALLAVLPALLIWTSLVASGETIHGLYLHPVFTIPAAFALALLVPLIDAASMPRKIWTYASISIGALAVAFAVLAGFQPAFSARAPQRLDVNYVEDAARHLAFWTADANAPLPAPLKKVANFSSTAERITAFYPGPAYVAPAGQPVFASPSAKLSVTDGAGGLRHVSLVLHGSATANQIIVAVPKEAGLRRISIEDQQFDVPKSWAQSSAPYSYIGCFSRDCSSKSLAIDLAAPGPLTLAIGEVRYGVPAFGRRLLSARPAQATASQNGDTTILVGSVTIPHA